MAAASTDAILLLTAPKTGYGTVGTVLIKDNKKECIFVIKIEDLEVKSKAPVGGVFKVERIDARSFKFWIETDGKPTMKCIIQNLPADITGEPKAKLEKGAVAITVNKPKTVTFGGTPIKKEYRQMIDLE
ncbi:hypothetical protein EB796_009069 [Bugula neritina]|uniref:Uncharacterized protein n=1 Tax=Bugula neritina TaxID=10212 RepID=A0A7J7K328_BUGNE|nr:hypothetical protein EB796_009069 [Bugula neritina]